MVPALARSPDAARIGGVDRPDDIDRTLAQLHSARELLGEVSLCVPRLRSAIPETATATATLHDRLAEWTRMLEIAVGELDAWESALGQARINALAEGTG